ncbi:MAG: DUF4912 domain-containing protein [Spirochaetaceae bacterium]|jgi:hypothetical protein|nr:DUF4912 domain-containing protein [Spirochaetaceae bacterium]
MKLRKPYLDHLATSELAAIAAARDIEISVPPDRNALIEALLELEEGEESGEAENLFKDEIALPLEEQEIENEHIQNLECGKKFERGRAGEYELAKIPLNYNVSVIYAVVRDPLWVFVCWELLAGQKRNLERRHNFNGYMLKVREKEEGTKRYTDFYSIPVGNNDSAWYLHFTPSGGTFRVELCARLSEVELVLAVTGDFTLPKMLNTRDTRYEGLWKLSGIGELEVLKNIGFRNAGLFEGV